MESNDRKKKTPFSGTMASRLCHIIGWVMIGLGFAVLFALVFGFVVKWIWNLLMPAVFGLGEITFWQAFGIVILAKLLFGGFNPHRHHRSNGDYRWHHDRHFPWKRFSDKQQHLKSDYRDWKYYHRFWHDEGAAAFEAYCDRQKRPGTPQNPQLMIRRRHHKRAFTGDVPVRLYYLPTRNQDIRQIRAAYLPHELKPIFRNLKVNHYEIRTL
jgi:hypothetical protein